MVIQHVVDKEGREYEVKSVHTGNIMLCGEWECIEMDIERYALKLADGVYTELHHRN